MKTGKDEEIDISKLTVFLDDVKMDYQNVCIQSMTHVKGSANIQIQVELIKRHKMKGGGVK
ncbi:hypothetical protein RhiirA4_479565 [Rhizophagus irregularis]|uniref:Uncharacterized protein n=1 Tax=Rhizophagus irregularis TaxID=588596 RepID=A0A2I1HGM4_9GLOM|nr:hypothetical protein RhiirA4_479565 [Rhizophagus irregularis]